MRILSLYTVLLTIVLTGCTQPKETSWRDTIRVDPVGRYQLLSGNGYTLTKSGMELKKDTVFRIDTVNGETHYFMDGEWFPVRQ